MAPPQPELVYVDENGRVSFHYDAPGRMVRKVLYRGTHADDAHTLDDAAKLGPELNWLQAVHFLGDP